jgi:hypothetical protein
MDIVLYTLDILMTHIEQIINLGRTPRPLTYMMKWHDVLLHQYASSCCRIPQRVSSLTQPSLPTREVINQLQRSWGSHCVASFLPSPRVWSMNSRSESTLLGRNGAFSKDVSLHGPCCSGIEVGEHNRSHRQSMGKTIQQMVLGTAIPTAALVDPQITRRQRLLPHDEALRSKHVCQTMQGL